MLLKISAETSTASRKKGSSRNPKKRLRTSGRTSLLYNRQIHQTGGALASSPRKGPLALWPRSSIFGLRFRPALRLRCRSLPAAIAIPTSSAIFPSCFLPFRVQSECLWTFFFYTGCASSEVPSTTAWYRLRASTRETLGRSGGLIISAAPGTVHFSIICCRSDFARCLFMRPIIASERVKMRGARIAPAYEYDWCQRSEQNLEHMALAYGLPFRIPDMRFERSKSSDEGPYR